VQPKKRKKEKRKKKSIFLVDGMWIAGCQSVRMVCNAARDPANLVVGDGL
jgi:hypothetical protein